jgi:FKBP-type peptidyl-prolyl cis-trans isomerase (trigger factor)
MQKKQISIHLRIILQKMFENTSIEYSDEYVQSDNWYLNYQWTEEQEQEFINWLANYLSENADAREELLYSKVKSKKMCGLAAKQFVTFFGWTMDLKKEKQEL